MPMPSISRRSAHRALITACSFALALPAAAQATPHAHFPVKTTEGGALAGASRPATDPSAFETRNPRAPTSPLVTGDAGVDVVSGPVKTSRGGITKVSTTLELGDAGRYTFIFAATPGSSPGAPNLATPGARLTMLKGSRIGTRTLRTATTAAVVTTSTPYARIKMIAQVRTAQVQMHQPHLYVMHLSEAPTPGQAPTPAQSVVRIP